MTLTKRQQQALIATHKQGYMWPSYLFKGLLGTATNERYFAYMSAYAIMDAGLAAYAGCLIYLTPTGQRLATILAELPAPLTRRQWQILLRFRDVGTVVGYCGQSCVRWYNGRGRWFIPVHDNESLQLCTTERTIRILSDAGLIGFDSLNRAHLTPLGEELVSLLP